MRERTHRDFAACLIGKWRARECVLLGLCYRGHRRFSASRLGIVGCCHGRFCSGKSWWLPSLRLKTGLAGRDGIGCQRDLERASELWQPKNQTRLSRCRCSFGPIWSSYCNRSTCASRRLLVGLSWRGCDLLKRASVSNASCCLF